MSSISNRSRLVVTCQIRSEKTRKSNLMCLTNEINVTKGRALPSKSVGAFYEAVDCSVRTVLYSYNNGRDLGLIKDKIRRRLKEEQSRVLNGLTIKVAESELTIQQAIELCKKMNATNKDADKIYKVSPLSYVITIRLQDVVPKGQDFSSCQPDRYYESPTYFRSKEEEFTMVLPVIPQMNDSYLSRKFKRIVRNLSEFGFKPPEDGEKSNAAYASTFMGKDKAKASYDDFVHQKEQRSGPGIEVETINTKSSKDKETERRFVSIVLPSSKKEANNASTESVSTEQKKTVEKGNSTDALDKLAQAAKDLP